MKSKFKKIIITGGAGFIGSNLAKYLLSKDIEKLLIIDDLSTGNLTNIKDILENEKIEFIESRIEDIENLNELFSDYEFCYHLAAGVGVSHIMNNLSKSLMTNILATHMVLESCKNMKIPILLASTSEVYGVATDEIWNEDTRSLIGPTTKLRWSYAASKMIDEFMALSLYQENMLKPIIVRLFNIIGPNQVSEFGMVVPKFIEAALKNEDLVVHGSGNQSRSFTWVDDVITYITKLSELEPYGEIFNIGQTDEITIKDLAELIISKTNSNSKIKYLSHNEVFGNNFDDPSRRTPGINKIVEFTGIKPTKKIDFMIDKIIEFKIKK